MKSFPDKKYNVIYADPPWNESGGGKIKRGADRHYSLMKTKDIMELPVDQITRKNCYLFLWVTNNFLKDGLKVLEVWGFRYITMITWLKEGNIGLGQYFRGKTEQCLFGIKGKGFAIRIGQGVTGFIAQRGKHSEKPIQMIEMIEKVSGGSKIELFARKKRKGWDAWGDEI